MPASLFKFKNYEVHSITTAHSGVANANVATWVMQSAMGGKYVSVALYLPDLTLELVRQSHVLNVNLLCQEQANLITRLGRRSGRDTDKLRRLPHATDARGCPYLTEAVGYLMAEVETLAPSGDHVVAVCRVVGQRVLHLAKTPLTLDYLRARKLVRG